MINKEQMQSLINRLDLIIPNLQKPKSDDELTFLTGMYENLNLGIATKVVANLKEDDIERLKKAPYITLKKMIVDQTDFDRQEKGQYKASYELYYAIDLYRGMIVAYNKKNGQPVLDKTRKMTALEEDYYLYELMSEEEFRYYNKQSEIAPKNKFYNPQTRKNEKGM